MHEKNPGPLPIPNRENMIMNAPSKTPPFRAEHVGSLLRPRYLKDAFRGHSEGKIDDSQLREIQDRAVREAISLQEDVGLKSITDGEFRRPSWFGGFVSAVQGLTVKSALFNFESEAGSSAGWSTAYVEGRLRRDKPIVCDEYTFLKAGTRQTAKVTMPTPSIVHFFRGREAVDPAVYPDMDVFWNDLAQVYRDEIAALGKLGCTYLQLDEVACAVLCDPNVRSFVATHGLNADQLLDRYVGMINSVIAGRPAGMTVGVHFCRGNYKGQWMASGGYEPIAEAVFARLEADALFLEYDSDRAGGFEPLRHVRSGTRVVLGLVSSKAPHMERIDELRARIDEAARFLPLDRLSISPQCGFASSIGGNPLTEADQRAKLKLVVDTAKAVWGTA